MTKKRGKINGINALLKWWWQLSFRELSQSPSLATVHCPLLAKVHYHGLAPAVLESGCVRDRAELQGKTAPAKGGKEGGGQPDAIIQHGLWHKHASQPLLQFPWKYTGLMDDDKTSCPSPDTKSRKKYLVLQSTALGQAHRLLRNPSPIWLWAETQGNSSSLLSSSCHPKLPPLLCQSFLSLKEENKDLVGPQINAQICSTWARSSQTLSHWRKGLV